MIVLLESLIQDYQVFQNIEGLARVKIYRLSKNYYYEIQTKFRKKRRFLLSTTSLFPKNIIFLSSILIHIVMTVHDFLSWR